MIKTIKYSKVEKEKFVEIISENRKLIFKICNSYCSNHEYRKDLEQEILLQLWKSIDNFDGRVKISTWIYKIALNTAITHYRDASKKKSLLKDVDTEIISFPDFEYDSDLDVKIAILYEAIRELSKINKALIVLYLDKYKHKEIANMLGLSESNVATKINRIKKNLQKRLVIIKN